MSAELIARLRQTFRWIENDFADPSAWWRDPETLAQLGPGLAALHGAQQPTVVAAVPARGQLLGPMVAVALGAGYVEIRKDRKQDGSHGQGVLRRSTPPDYAQRGLTLTLRREVLRPRDRVLFVDDWIETGAQARATRSLVEDAEATWIGAAVIVDATTAATRQDLAVRSLLAVGQL